MFNALEEIFRWFRKQGLRLTPLKYYRNDPAAYRALPFENVLQDTHTSLTQRSPTHWTLECTYKGNVRTTHIFLLAPFTPKKPSVVFHHPSGETNHAFAFHFILGKFISSRANTFLIKAQHHETTGDFLTNCVDSFLHHQLTFAGSVLAVESAVQFHKQHTNMKIVVSGASMGGIVSSLHAYFFGSADWYVPLAAYPNVGKIFMGRSYEYAVSEWQIKRKNMSYHTSFDLKKPFRRSVTQKITPILGTSDGIVHFSDANAYWKRHGIQPLSYPYGHFTPAIMRHTVRTIVQTHLS